jgi:hypothetical protein
VLRPLETWRSGLESDALLQATVEGNLDEF